MECMNDKKNGNLEKKEKTSADVRGAYQYRKRIRLTFGKRPTLLRITFNDLGDLIFA